ncbi:MAG: DUF58 domain-containing protein [Isosphaeraceae bacterium]|nr:DUF58 domain-containing protein [Isosphaeraceae bacterium]
MRAIEFSSILEREIAPALDPLFRRLRTPLAGIALATVAAVLCGFFLHPRGFVVAAGLLAVAVLGVVWPWMSVRGTSGSIGFDRIRVREGEPVEAHLVVRNRMPWGVWGLKVHSGPGSIDLGGFEHAPALRTMRVTTTFVPRCRGVHPSAHPTIGCGFPFGLRESTRPLAVDSRLIVHPRTLPVGAAPDAPGGRASDGAALRDRAGDAGDPMGVRAYRRGDPLRRIHWAQTARHGELIVCELQSNAISRLRIVVDSHADAHLDLGPEGSREWAIRIAASLAVGWIEQGAEISLILGAGEVETRAGSSRTRSTRLLDALAAIDASADLRLSALLDGDPMRRRSPGATILVTTDRSLAALDPDRTVPRSTRIIALRTAGFGAAPTRELVDSFLYESAWIRVDSPGHVAPALRRLGKESIHVQ